MKGVCVLFSQTDVIFHFTRKSQQKPSLMNTNEQFIAHETIISFFKTYGFGTEMSILRHFSILYPEDRVYILKKLLESGIENIDLYDKLSLALTKNGNKNEATAILEKGFLRGIIDSSNYYLMTHKTSMFNKVENMKYEEQKFIIKNELKQNNTRNALIFLNLLDEFIDIKYSPNNI